jgi:HlyD family type I secretion membrane fusion protein
MGDMSWTPSVMEESQSLSSPKGETRKGLYIASVFFVGLLGWAALTPLDAGATAQGVVAVSGSRQVVQHSEGGIVTVLNVAEGQQVRQGDVLIQISEGQLVAAERGMTGELEAELNGARLVSDPIEFRTLPEADRPLAEEAIRGQRVLFNARRNSTRSERQVLGQQILQQHAQIQGFDHQIQSNREQQRLIGEELVGLKDMASRGFVPMTRVRAMERTAAELDGNFGSLGADVARTHEAIGQARMQIVSLTRKVLEDVATQLRDVQLRLDELQPKLIATREQLSRSMIRATATGRVMALKVHTVGGIVAPGETLMEIVPQNRELVVEAKAAPKDADDLKIGMDTQVRFSSLQERNMPILYGKISKLSADSFEDDRTGMSYFKIEVLVPPSELEKVKQVRGENVIRAGLPADVLVPLRKRSALSYLTEPLTQMFWLAGREH